MSPTTVCRDYALEYVYTNGNACCCPGVTDKYSPDTEWTGESFFYLNLVDKNYSPGHPNYQLQEILSPPLGLPAVNGVGSLKYSYWLPVVPWARNKCNFGMDDIITPIDTVRHTAVTFTWESLSLCRTNLGQSAENAGNEHQ